MEKNAALYDLFMDAAGAIYTALAAAAPPTPAPVLLQLRAGLAESAGWFLVQASEFAPEPLTVELLRVRDIYASERIVAALLELMAGEGWLERDAAGRYALAEGGRALLATRRAARAAVLAETMLLPHSELARLRALLEKLIDASLGSPSPPGTWCLAHSRRRAPPAGAPPLMHTLQFFDDINAFRDDAHMAAWRHFGLAGYAWEAFALLCGGAAQNATQVAGQLQHRGYSRAEFAAALEELAERGWLERDGDGYLPTETGLAAHRSAERLTDLYFFRPWEMLSAEETEGLYNLLCRLRDSAPAEKEETV
jgi:hypothetical protein